MDCETGYDWSRNFGPSTSGESISLPGCDDTKRMSIRHLAKIHTVKQNCQMIWRILSLRMSKVCNYFVYVFQISIDDLNRE